MGLFSPREGGNPSNQRFVWLDPNDYNETIVRDASSGDPIVNSTATWSVSVIRELKEWRGINLTITVKNVSQIQQSAPFVRFASGMYHPNWTGAGVESNLRHVINYMNHDSYGMRSSDVKYPSIKNPATDKFGNTDAVYSVNWFAPCLAIDNSLPSVPSYGCQMMSVSTNYPFPFRIYGDFDPTSLKAYFRIEGNVNTDSRGILDKIEPGLTRTWKVWIRYEDYSTTSLLNPHYATNSYRKIAALRSYEPYFVWYWANNSTFNNGPRVSGRVYGVELAGASAPKAYFAPRDNQRRYFLFSTQDKKSLEGRLPLPGQQYVSPQNTTGWKELLDGVVDVSTLKTYGYQAVLVLNPAGWGNADLGSNPAFFTNLPINLRNTLAEIKQWEEDNSFRVLFATDNTLNKVNLGDFNEAAQPFDEENPLHTQFETDNFLQGGLRSVSGLTLLGLPELMDDSLIESYVGGWRSAYSSVTMASGHRLKNDFYNYMVPAYYDRSEFLTADYSKGGRDWFLDVLFTGVDPWVYMPIKSWYGDYGISSSTENAYDNYVQKIELDYQAIPVTIGRIVKKECLLPKKVNWKEDYNSYSSIIGTGSLCDTGDPVLGGKKVCTSINVHKTYSSNIPAELNTDILGYYQFPGLYDWNVGHSWFPCMGGSGDIYSRAGDSLLWLYQDDKLQLAKQTLINNITGINNNNQDPLIPSGYVGDFWLNWEPGIYNEGSSTNGISVGIGDSLNFYSVKQPSALLRSSPSNPGLIARTLRKWWIWVQDQVNAGWEIGKTTDEQDFYLQTQWCERWTVWMEEILSTIRSLRPGIDKIGLYGSVPKMGEWAIHGLDYGETNPEVANPYRELENSHWYNWANLFDYMGQSMYLWDAVVDYDSPFLYNTSQRRAADPIQARIFYLLSIKNFQDVARRAGNKDFIPFIRHKYIRSTGYVNQNLLGFIYESIYLCGGQGSIWWDTVSDHSSAVGSLGVIQDNWYPITKFIAGRIFSYNIDIDPPSPITETGDSVTGEESETYLAKFGKIRVTSLGGKIQRDNISGFGVQRYRNIPSGSVGDLFPEDYSGYNVIAIANSIDGTFEVSKALGKYNRVEVDIIDPVLTNVGMPHWVIEDTFEWINSGMPSHLSQVHHSNVISGGISSERISPGLQELTAPAFQAKYIVPCNASWYDKLNSTVDYDLFFDNGSRNLSIPYANCVLSTPELNLVWVGGLGGVLLINTVTKNVGSLDIESDRILLIKSIKRYQDTIYILDEIKLYFYDITTGNITEDTATGLPKKLHSMISIFGSNLVIGAEDGIYARKVGSLTWEKVVTTTGTVNVMTSPDAALAVSDDGESYYSTDGFIWIRVGIVNDKVVNKIQKHRSQILFATTKGLYQDGGTFYTRNLSLQLLDVFEDAAKSSQISINDIDSDFNKAVIGLSDGRYFVYTNDFVLNTDSKLKSIHKVLILGDDIWLFGYNQYKIISEESIRKLATGYPIR